MRTVPAASGEMREEFLKPLGQADYDTVIARATMGEALSRISRCALLAA